MWRDVQNGWRQMRRNKFLSAAIILLLAVGIGANTAIFSFVDALLLKSLPVREPQNLYLLQTIYPKQVRPDTSFFYRQYQALVQNNHSVFTAAVAEQKWDEQSFQTYGEGDHVRLITTQLMSPNYFSELGIKPVIGRLLAEADADLISNIPVVLSYQFWISEFNRDQGIVGRIIRVKNYSFVVAGVLPQDFHGIDVERAPDLRLPVSAAPVMTGSAVLEPGGDYPLQFQILARLAPGVSHERAAAAVLPDCEEWKKRCGVTGTRKAQRPGKLENYRVFWNGAKIITLRC